MALFGILADFVVVLHLTFVLFVLFGGLLVLRWPHIAWLHLPAAAWGAFVECSGWLCPLTPLENWLRHQADLQTYDGDFAGRYLLPLLYPSALTRHVQLLLGGLVLIMNVTIYSWLWRNQRSVPSGELTDKS